MVTHGPIVRVTHNLAYVKALIALVLGFTQAVVLDVDFTFDLIKEAFEEWQIYFTCLVELSRRWPLRNTAPDHALEKTEGVEAADIIVNTFGLLILVRRFRHVLLSFYFVFLRGAFIGVQDAENAITCSELRLQLFH